MTNSHLGRECEAASCGAELHGQRREGRNAQRVWSFRGYTTGGSREDWLRSWPYYALQGNRDKFTSPLFVFFLIHAMELMIA